MQPNNQQGYYQPEPTEPAQPVAPPQPGSAAPVAPVTAPAPLASPVQTTVSAAPVVQPTPVTAGDSAPIEAASQDDAPITWSAYEYIHQEKGTMWFTVFGIVTALLVGATIFFQQWSFLVLIIVIAVVIVVSAKRPPRELTYALTDEGLSIDGKMHSYDSFKAFGIIRDGEEFSVMLIPTQRFQPGITVYFPEEAGEAIVDILGGILPMKDLKLDAVDRLVRLLRL